MQSVEEYMVEKVIDKRTLPNGQVEYLLKWLNWPSRYNSWEPQEHLKCDELVEEFEREQLAKSKKLRRRPRRNALDSVASNYDDVVFVTNDNVVYTIPRICGFDRGLVAERIVGATEKDGLIFLVKWKDVDLHELVPANIARYKCPKLVIDFFEKNITWRKMEDSLHDG